MSPTFKVFSYAGAAVFSVCRFQGKASGEHSVRFCTRRNKPAFIAAFRIKPRRESSPQLSGRPLRRGHGHPETWTKARHRESRRAKWEKRREGDSAGCLWEDGCKEKEQNGYPWRCRSRLRASVAYAGCPCGDRCCREPRPVIAESGV